MPQQANLVKRAQSDMGTKAHDYLQPSNVLTPQSSAPHLTGNSSGSSGSSSTSHTSSLSHSVSSKTIKNINTTPVIHASSSGSISNNNNSNISNSKPASLRSSASSTNSNSTPITPIPLPIVQQLQHQSLSSGGSSNSGSPYSSLNSTPSGSASSTPHSRKKSVKISDEIMNELSNTVVVMSGWMEVGAKMVGTKTVWNKRYFVYESNNWLSYYKDSR